MSRALPFTEASIARLVRGLERAGKFVVGAKPDGTLIVADKPIDTAPEIAQPSPAAPRRLEDYFNGDQGEA